MRVSIEYQEHCIAFHPEHDRYVEQNPAYLDWVCMHVVKAGPHDGFEVANYISLAVMANTGG